MPFPPKPLRRARRVGDPLPVKEKPAKPAKSLKVASVSQLLKKLVLPPFRWVPPPSTDDDVIPTEQEIIDFERVFGISMAALKKWNKLYVD